MNLTRWATKRRRHIEDFGTSFVWIPRRGWQCVITRGAAHYAYTDYDMETAALMAEAEMWRGIAQEQAAERELC
jgi:hypothetical protein